MTTALVWLRRDLRLADNPALDHACRHADAVVCVYVHAPDEEGAWAPGAASRWWLHHSLAELERALTRFGQRLVIARGPALAALRRLSDETGAQLVCWNRLYEPATIARDTLVRSALEEQGVEARSFNGGLLCEPWEVLTAQNEPYRVFTPFWRACTRHVCAVSAPLPVPLDLRSPGHWPRSAPLAALELLPKVRWDARLAASWTPGEEGAHAALERFLDAHVDRYAARRNRPDLLATSRLSPHLHFGELSPRQVLAALYAHDALTAGKGGEAFLRELGWREFAHHLLYHFPATPEQPLDVRFASYPWRADERALDAWRRGRTGIPIVDAGMRELWHTGFMHNRVRMIAASFLTKNLRIHWLEGARWFWDTLVDADLANNTLGWQWTAGCGADAAPYFRIFNPVLQAERHDPARAYLRRWVPELERLPDSLIHRPWTAEAEALDAAGVPVDSPYRSPLIDLRASRADALAGYEQIRSTSRTVRSA